jgi:hypothetical protein
MIFAVFEEKSIESSYRFRVISTCKSQENKSLSEIGGRCRHLAEVTRPVDRPTQISHTRSLDISRPAVIVFQLLALF